MFLRSDKRIVTQTRLDAVTQMAPEQYVACALRQVELAIRLENKKAELRRRKARTHRIGGI